MPRKPSETVLITGASGGIGLELAKLFAADGSQLVLVARSEDKLRSLASELQQQHGATVRVEVADLSQPGMPRQLADRLLAAGVQVDVLVNNAGFGGRGTVIEQSFESQSEMVRLNALALLELTRLLLPSMVERKRGGLLNVASTAAFQPGPNMAVYFATKAFVLSLSEALAEELKGTGVQACCLCPGPTETGFAAAAKMEDARLFSLGTMTAEAVARAGYRGLRRGKAIVIPRLTNKLLAFSIRFVPRAWARKIAARLPGAK